MITLHFGRYNGRKDVVKKLEIMTALNEQPIISRTPFDPLDPVFTITFATPVEHAMYNYGWFEYHAKKYCGWLNWTAIQEATYTINMYIDPVVTAYENGCMNNVKTKLLYSQLGAAKVIDPRVSYTNNNKLYLQYFNDTELKNAGVLYTVLAPNGVAQNGAYFDTTSFDWYLTTRTGAISLSNKLREIADTPLAGGIASALFSTLNPVFVRGADPLQNMWMIDNEYVSYTPNIRLYIQQGGVLGDIDVKYQDIGVTDGFFTQSTYNFPTRIKDFPINNFPTDYSILTTPINLKVYDLATFTFTLNNFGITTLTSIGYTIRYDMIGKNYYITLRLNGVEYQSTVTITPMTEHAYYLISNPEDGISKVHEYAQGIGTAITNASGASGLTANLLSQSSNFMTQHISRELMNVEGISANSASNFSLINFDNYHISLWCNYPTRLTDISYSSLYGKPDGEYRSLNSITWGYFQTENVQLKVNNLPIAIIQQAETQLNGGVWFTNPA